MFTPILGRVSVQNASASPGAWAQLHPDNKLNTITTARRRSIFTPVNEFSFGLYPGPDTSWKEHKNQLWSQDELWTDLRSGSTSIFKS